MHGWRFVRLCSVSTIYAPEDATRRQSRSTWESVQCSDLGKEIGHHYAIKSLLRGRRSELGARWWKLLTWYVVVTRSARTSSSILSLTLTSNPPLVRTVTQCHRVFLNPHLVGPSICTHTWWKQHDLEICTMTWLATCLPFLWWIQTLTWHSVGRCDKPHFCSFHNITQFLFKKCTEYVNRHY